MPRHPSPFVRMLDEPWPPPGVRQVISIGNRRSIMSANLLGFLVHYSRNTGHVYWYGPPNGKAWVLVCQLAKRLHARLIRMDRSVQVEPQPIKALT